VGRRGNNSSGAQGPGTFRCAKRPQLPWYHDEHPGVDSRGACVGLHYGHRKLLLAKESIIDSENPGVRSRGACVGKYYCRRKLLLTKKKLT
jgi:hypothetical protein